MFRVALTVAFVGVLSYMLYKRSQDVFNPTGVV